MDNTLLLNQDTVKQLITMEEVVTICDKTFKDMGEKKTVNPTKVLLDLGENSKYPPYQGFMNAMPSYIGWQDVAGIKWAGGMLKRKELNLPYITSLILLINPQLGNFLGAMDGELITNFRTGAQTANALKYIKQNNNSITLGLYGAGQQGRTQLMALSKVFNINKLIVYDVFEEASEKFKKEMKSYVKGDIIIAKSPEEAADADTIVCVTQSKTPFLKDEWIKEGTVVFPMGSYQECEDEVILNSDHIIVDHVEQCLHRGALSNLTNAGKIDENNIYATIGDLASKKNSVTSLQSKKVVCIPIGTGAMDISVAKVVLDKAKENNLGDSFKFV